jgi:hypothetical protein
MVVVRLITSYTDTEFRWESLIGVSGFTRVGPQQGDLDLSGSSVDVIFYELAIFLHKSR